MHQPIQTCFRNKAIVHLKWKVTRLCIFPQAGSLLRVYLSSLTYQALCTHAHLFIAAFLICSHGVGFGKLPSYIPFIPADIQLLGASWVLLTPSISEAFTLYCTDHRATTLTNSLGVDSHAHRWKEVYWPEHCERIGVTCKNHQLSVCYPLSHTLNNYLSSYLFKPKLRFLEAPWKQVESEGVSEEWQRSVPTF